jgi:hypothetical protein
MATGTGTEVKNAFEGKLVQPTAVEIAAALGASATSWNLLIDWLAEKHEVATLEWKSLSPKYGWSLRLKLKQRTILYLAPCNGCFRAAFILGDRAMEAVRESTLPKAIATTVQQSPRYPEGTGVRLMVKDMKDLPAIRKLVEIKLAH